MGSRRGKLTDLSDRQYYMRLIDEAVSAGARKKKACEEIGVPIRSTQRWLKEGEILPDKRPTAKKPEPSNKLTQDEKQSILDTCNADEFAHLPPSQIVPMLTGKDEYIASESSFYRVLKANNQLKHRGKSRPKGSRKTPLSFTASKPNEVWTWDITYCPSRVIGMFYYLYMIIDIYSRKIVGWEVHERQCGDKAAELLQRTVWAERCLNQDVVLHSDNGSPMKSLTMRAKMQDLGIVNSYSRPGVSNDNAYSESLFKTVKYSRQWPSEGFNDLEEVRQWCQGFVSWYNNEHRHSKINFVTPCERHEGKDEAILQKRHDLYQRQKSKNPSRWSKTTRNWEKAGDVELNPVNKKEAA